MKTQRKEKEKKIFSSDVTDWSCCAGLDVRRQAIGKEEGFCLCLRLATKTVEEEEEEEDGEEEGEEEKRTSERYVITHTGRHTQDALFLSSHCSWRSVAAAAIVNRYSTALFLSLSRFRLSCSLARILMIKGCDCSWARVGGSKRKGDDKFTSPWSFLRRHWTPSNAHSSFVRVSHRRRRLVRLTRYGLISCRLIGIFLLYNCVTDDGNRSIIRTKMSKQRLSLILSFSLALSRCLSVCLLFFYWIPNKKQQQGQKKGKIFIFHIPFIYLSVYSSEMKCSRVNSSDLIFLLDHWLIIKCIYLCIQRKHNRILHHNIQKSITESKKRKLTTFRCKWFARCCGK